MSAANQTIYLKDYQPPAFLVSHVVLDFALGKDHTVVTATLSVQRNGTHQQALILDGEKMTLLKLSLDAEELDPSRYQLSDTSLSISEVANTFSLEIVTQLQPHLNTQLSGLYQSSGNFCTQCEAHGFRRITYFPDRPDVLSEYTVTMTADKTNYPVLLSNGDLLKTGANNDGSHWAYWHDPYPKPCYLFALVAGDLKSINDSFTTQSGRQVALNIYTQAHNIDKCQHAMQSLQKAMRWDEQVYGLEYDLGVYNIVAVDDFNMGAMENKGLNVFNSRYVLANQASATDSDYEGIESVIAHEYFHNWSGNRVTCRDWFQLSLKEGFTVFRDQEFSADMGSRAVKRIRDVQLLRAYQFKEDAGPMAHPIRPESYQEINNFYTVTIYEKGAEVIRMMHHLLGAEGFRKGSDLYFQRFDGQAVTTEDFIQAMEDANNADLRQFRYWYTQAGTPQVLVEQSFTDHTLNLTIHQSYSDASNKKPLQIPLNMALFARSGEKLQEQTLELTQATQLFRFEDLDAPPIVSMLRDFSAPIKLDFKQSNAELAHLIAFEDNGFARWEAMQRLSLNLLLPAIGDDNSTINLNAEHYQQLVQALTTLINSQPEDKAILSEMLRLPSTAYITEQCTAIHPLSIQHVRQHCIKRLAGDLEPALIALYQDSIGEFSLSGEAMAQRALKNVCLSYLLSLDSPDYYQLAQHQFDQANNMTDRLAAFASLLASDYQQKPQLIETFYQQWQDDTLVLDKWFALQASTLEQDGLDTVKALTQHPAFAMNNPNKVRAVIGAFTQNTVVFHHNDGSGYAFFADQIIALDTINPQIAARLASVFNNWQAHAEPHRTQMQSQLQRINAQADLSIDVSEIVGKALALTFV